MDPKLVRLMRVLGAAVGSLAGLTLAQAGALFGGPGDATLLTLVWMIAWTVVGFALGPYLTIIPAARLVRGVEALSTGEFVAGVLGLVVGLLIGALLSLPLGALAEQGAAWLPFAVTLITGLGTMGLMVAKREDLAATAASVGLIRPATADGAGGGEPRIVVDTSAIIDGRIAEIVASGFVAGTLLVPRYVLDELQRIADLSDPVRRNRGRRGLEILARMQKDAAIPLEIVDDVAPELAEVDAKLVALARRRSRVILTTDFNLNRVAELQGVRVMNVNSLANAVKPALVPGEELVVRVIQEGREAGQGVGYLDDGTMIVVEGGSRLIDREVGVSVTRVIQTVAGRMVFAQPHAE